jgi:hypothetical protein
MELFPVRLRKVETVVVQVGGEPVQCGGSTIEIAASDQDELLALLAAGWQRVWEGATS